MLNNLLESKPQKQKSVGGTIASGIMHVIIIAVAVQATLNAGQKKETREQKIDFVQVKKDEPPPPKDEPKPPPPDVTAAPPPPKGFQVLTAPVNIPDVLPEIDLSKKLTNEADFTGKGVAGGRDKGVVGGVAPVNSDQPLFEFQVEKPVMQAPGSAQPRYPDILKSAGVEGEVLAQFVVDTTGRAEVNTFKVLKTSHELFASAVKNALPNMKFLPAEVGGRKVKQLVQQPFVFAISK
ncbi:MAG: TonB family protein [Gemmatimonadetes bacterium]|nr:TonB family protein [Gemmatimonadota bacterium]MBI3566917.1 TonB family protein [Gemmatimonadota bacterium]